MVSIDVQTLMKLAMKSSVTRGKHQQFPTIPAPGTLYGWTLEEGILKVDVKKHHPSRISRPHLVQLQKVDVRNPPMHLPITRFEMYRPLCV